MDNTLIDDAEKIKISDEKIVGNHILENILESEFDIDTVLSCSDGKVGAHRTVLVAASPFLKFLLKDHVIVLKTICIIFYPLYT